MDLNKKIQHICKLFRIDYEYLGYETIQMGNVNQTYKVNFRLPDDNLKSFLVQKVNTYAFRNPIGLMDNIDKVTEFIRAKKPDQISLHFHHTAERKTYVIDGNEFWRMTNYVPSVTFNTVTDLHIIRSAGKAFGEFQTSLNDFDISQLIETIPDFHNTRKRYENLICAIREDKANRVAEANNEIQYLLSVQDLACSLTDLQTKGQLPLRVTHNDTKINNVLFDPDSNNALIVIDLDTVMPGLIGHDFGDAIRFAANFVEEDCRDIDAVGLDLDVFQAFTEGFLSETAGNMTKQETNTLALSCFVLTIELATRFLADYLNGDVYFNIKYPDHNLVRTRCQIALAKDMLKKMDDMERIIRNHINNNIENS